MFGIIKSMFKVMRKTMKSYLAITNTKATDASDITLHTNEYIL